MENTKLPKALYKGNLPIGDIELECAVLDNDTRIITTPSIFKAFGRQSRGWHIDRKENMQLALKERFPNYLLAQPPVFISSISLLPYINDVLLKLAHPIQYIDGGITLEGYNADILSEICNLYLTARRNNALNKNQMFWAQQSEILLQGFAKVGIIALIDEATGFQTDRKYNALRLLLQAYLEDKPTEWIKQFPDDFFLEMDRLYGNEKLKSNQRPSYYEKFINTYIYEPIENGQINPELQKRYKGDKKRHNKHQWFTENIGKQQLQLQIGKIMGLMQVAPNLKWFKQKQERQGQLSLFPDLE